MTMTDPIADMLTRLRNGNAAYHDYVVMPNSKIKVEIAKVLQQEGYVTGYEVQDAPVGKVLRIDLKYGPNRERTISGVRRISKPGLRQASAARSWPTSGKGGAHQCHASASSPSRSRRGSSSRSPTGPSP